MSQKIVTNSQIIQFKFMHPRYQTILVQHSTLMELLCIGTTIKTQVQKSFLSCNPCMQTSLFCTPKRVKAGMLPLPSVFCKGIGSEQKTMLQTFWKYVEISISFLAINLTVKFLRNSNDLKIIITFYVSCRTQSISQLDGWIGIWLSIQVVVRIGLIISQTHQPWYNR